jgi:hypothetical protein
MTHKLQMTLFVTILLIAVFEGMVIASQWRTIHDARIYIGAGCHGRYQGYGDLDQSLE